ncbi:MAG: CNP1-like family protein [Rhodoferax sp.]|nr:CNP1-like family protein [Rhodoferax sp.]
MNPKPSLTFSRFLKTAFCILALSIAGTSAAQIPQDNPDWEESKAPAPPAFSADKMLALDMPPFVSLKFGIDPATISITPDGIVRYVVVARSQSGAVTAFYEGILCARGEVKRYARSQSDGTWRNEDKPAWRPLNDNQPSRHALVFARQGACDASTAASSVADIVRKMK